MVAECRNLIQGNTYRVTRLNECGEVVGGLCAYVVTDGFISVAMTDNVESPDEFKVKLSNGRFCVNQRSDPLLNWIEPVITMCGVDPEMVEILTGSPLVLDDSPTPVAVGFGTDTDSYATGNFALEIWTNIAKPINGAACPPGGTRYGYMLLPFVVQGTIGDITVENGPINFTINNAVTSNGNGWGVGPYNVIKDRFGAPSPLLEAIPTTRHRHLQFTSFAPPASVCGCQFLSLAS